MTKRKNECFKCTSRNCYTRIFRLDAPVFDEVACVRHSYDLGVFSDTVLGNPGYMRTHQLNTGGVRRGEVLTQDCPRCKGTGKNPEHSLLGYPGQPCYYCKGTGQSEVVYVESHDNVEELSRDR